MAKNWKYMSVVAVSIVTGAVGLSNAANAAVPTFTKEDVRFCAKAHENNLIRPGDEGACVRVMQQLLNKTDLKPGLRVDGDYGAKTKKAVMAHERSLNWNVDGIVGKGVFQSLQAFAPAGEGTLGKKKSRSGLGDAPGAGEVSGASASEIAAALAKQSAR
jgi:peptidoglycan hydrolase-like protein with peptidoglycan-binding domain